MILIRTQRQLRCQRLRQSCPCRTPRSALSVGSPSTGPRRRLVLCRARPQHTQFLPMDTWINVLAYIMMMPLFISYLEDIRVLMLLSRREKARWLRTATQVLSASQSIRNGQRKVRTNHRVIFQLIHRAESSSDVHFANVARCGYGGIGHALVSRLRNESARRAAFLSCSSDQEVLLTIFRGSEIEVIATLLPHENANHLVSDGVHITRTDVTKDESVQELKQTAQKLTGGKLDILINNASVLAPCVSLRTEG